MSYFYTSDAVTVASPTWTELGTAGGVNLVSGGGALYATPRRTRLIVGGRDGSSLFTYLGNLSRVVLSDNGVTIADCDLRTQWLTSRRTDPQGNIWSLQGSGWSWTLPSSLPPYGTLANRPAAGSTPDKTMYSATDQNGGTIYQVQSGASGASRVACHPTRHKV